MIRRACQVHSAAQRDNAKAITPPTAIAPPTSERARGALAFQHEREGDDHDRRDGQDGEDNARRRGFQRPLHATDPERLAREAIHQHPGPHAAPLLL